jgi:zinc transporter ZupT
MSNPSPAPEVDIGMESSILATIALVMHSLIEGLAMAASLYCKYNEESE